MNHEEINWGDKPLGEIEEVLDDMSPKERTLFLKYLGTHYPHLKIDWLDWFLEMRHLSRPEEIEAMEDFVSWFPSQFPDDYSSINFIFSLVCLCLKANFYSAPNVSEPIAPFFSKFVSPSLCQAVPSSPL